MPKDGSATRQRILEVAHQLVLAGGFAGTSIDQVLAKAEITKGAFFHHFKSKAKLAAALAQRYADLEDRFFGEQMQRAEKLCDDPLEKLEHFLEGVGNALAERDSPAGCLFASYCYEAEQFDSDIKQVMEEQMRKWRGHYSLVITQIIKTHPPRFPIDVLELADHFMAVVEGGFVMGRLYNDPTAVARHLQHYGHYVRLIFDSGR
jgi:TetR/AcrR family transcriptional repressor of nem operon